MTENIRVLEVAWPFLLHGLWKTILFSLIGIAFGTLLGFLLGLVRSMHVRWSDRCIGAYLHVFRGSPFLVQLYVVYFVLPNCGIELDSQTAGILALSLYTSSYVTEIVASAIDAISRGQREAARSCGMTQMQTYVHVLVPQAVRMALPPLASVFVIVIKSTSLFSLIGLGELLREGQVVIMREGGQVVFIYCVVGALYFVFCFPILLLALWGERRTGGLAVKLD